MISLRMALKRGSWFSAAVARALDVDSNGGAERRGRPARKRDDAIGEQDAFVDVVRDEQHRLADRRARCARSRSAASRA